MEKMNKNILEEIENELVTSCNDKFHWSTCVFNLIDRHEYVDIVVWNIAGRHKAYLKFHNVLWKAHWDWNEYHSGSTEIKKLKGEELEWVCKNIDSFKRRVEWAKTDRKYRDLERNKKRKICDDKKNLKCIEKHFGCKNGKMELD